MRDADVHVDTTTRATYLPALLRNLRVLLRLLLLLVIDRGGRKPRSAIGATDRRVPALELGDLAVFHRHLLLQFSELRVGSLELVFQLFVLAGERGVLSDSSILLGLAEGLHMVHHLQLLHVEAQLGVLAHLGLKLALRVLEHAQKRVHC
eukprot:CAMPEP_0185604676 /NCGR_PEP_ID=MMETSP0436-20130131/3465_1 /TAXON_ID=626734 ORGANISM="Favella taraikaensis, Strain Fe Narragansett Bay" /NCGR_SAMPLE_ID=MMETSP0436 /ASSEMBLY_ACC=CAM_ASM_000390 /LENGTH=149 /DNA_ID=CAMNT_0028235599 /DNA_START=202 /DNA_END=651 /DNA_ORIENTATION=-